MLDWDELRKEALLLSHFVYFKRWKSWGQGEGGKRERFRFQSCLKWVGAGFRTARISLRVILLEGIECTRQLVGMFIALS